MNRPIKFRCWDKPNKIMLYGIERLYDGYGKLTDEKGEVVDVYKTSLNIDSFGNNINGENEDVEVMQSTGLKDKNGKEIYESDIVKVEGVSEKWRGKNGTWSVFWHEGNAAFCFDKCYELIGLCPAVDLYGKYKYEYYEVIGNIYENPTLLSPSL